MNRFEQVTKYIRENKSKTKSKPTYHFAPEVGWLNDPNGFTYFNGEYHLYYQYNPYNVDHGHKFMAWGHATSKDLVKWETHDIAITPEEPYDFDHIFSGTSIEIDGNLHAMYTGHFRVGSTNNVDNLKRRLEHQCLAVSYDGGYTFEKSEHNPVIPVDLLPKEYDNNNFRDPKIINYNGEYYALCIARTFDGHPDLLMFKSKDKTLEEWEFYSLVLRENQEDIVFFECPDLIKIGDKDVLIGSICPQDHLRGKVGEEVYYIGKMDFKTGKFNNEAKGTLDSAVSYYAAQTLTDENGVPHIIAWCFRRNFDRPEEEAKSFEEYGYQGIMTLVRELDIKDNKLIQKPPKNIKDYYTSQNVYEKLETEEINSLAFKSKSCRLKIEFSKLECLTITLYQSSNKKTKLIFDKENNTLTHKTDYFSINDYVYDDINIIDNLELELFVDNHVYELFVNGGEQTYTFVNYDELGSDISFDCNGETMIRYLEINDIEL